MKRSHQFSTLFSSNTGGSKAMFWQRESYASWAESRWGVILCTVLWLAVLSPSRAAAELPLLSLGAKADDEILTDVLVGSHQMGMGLVLPFPCTEEIDGLALETRQRYDNAAISVDAAYWTQFAHQNRKRPVGVSAQLGLHVRTATRTTEDAGLGPSVGLTVSHELVPPECMCLQEIRTFVGVQGTTVMSPSTGQLQVPLRASLGLQTRLHMLHLMLVGRGGWDDIRLGFSPRPVVEVTLGIGLIRFL
ncbi:hypothetical protein [Myxococcus xanthus]|uniref:hypothetical protein n=1 Tax=Myxococcus xanthus TaxID=34 RepID=UPI0011269C20|nr:hypothetical protein [Myxococcus xanthus]QDF04725.1 hypothetical protein BHS04_16160 [Myxococcus xanthus]